MATTAHLKRFAHRGSLLLQMVTVALALQGTTEAQVRLPQVEAFQESYLESLPQQREATPATFAYPSELSESGTISALPSEPLLADAEVVVQPRQVGKPGVVQQISFTSTWISRLDHENDYGTVDFELYAVLGFPMPTRESPLLIKPGFEMHLLDGPVEPGLPEQLFDEYIQFRWMSKVGEHWGVDLSITPGIHGDFEELDSDAFRMTAHALASYDWSPELMLVGGVLYLDSEAIDVVPAAGAIWKPDEDTRWELIFPRPRFARRVYADCDVERWWYVAGEFGSNQWAVTRDDGVQDVITMQDMRLLTGVERKNISNTGLSGRFEVGYVFGRELEFTSELPSIEPGDTIMMRAGVWY